MKKFLLLCSFVFVAGVVLAQERSVTGKVTSAEDGSALPGVNVVLKGTTNGTVTDTDGNYRVSVPASGGTLVFSFIGLRTQEVPIGERAVVDVNLSLDVTQLSEVVVTGSGIATDKKKLGIAVESVAADKLPPTPSASIDQALVGKIAGAQISSISGNPGDPVNILLRGVNTVQNGTKPLIMVDGVQMAATDINSLDLSNIERIEVVQGAASAAIYGAQGANGVIQVFTKKGQKGKVAINFSSSYAANTFLNTGDVHKARKHPYITDSQGNLTDVDGNLLQYDQYGSLPGISYRYGKTGATPEHPNGNGATRYAIQDIRNNYDQDYKGNIQYYDHFKQVFQTGYTTNNTLSFSGAGDKSDYSVAVANNHTLSPVMKNGSVDRSNITLNLGTELFRGFKFRSTTQLVYTKNNMHPGLGAAGDYNYGKGNSLGNINGVYSFLNTSPFFDLTRKLADGTYPGYQEGNGFLSVNALNPYYRMEYSSQLDNKIDVIQSFDANYKVNKFLELDAKYGINYRTENSKWTYLNQSQNLNSDYYFNYVGYFAPDLNGEIDNWQYTNSFQNFLANAYFRTDFQDDFHINLPIQTSTQVGFDYRKRKYTELDTYGLGVGLTPPYNMYATTGGQYVAGGPTSTQPGDYVEQFVTYGYLVNQKVDFGDYGGVTAGFRSDWSSAFGGGSKPFTFPHFDGHILPSTFWKDSGLGGLFPYLKLRAAYGAAGIQPSAFDRYPILALSPAGASPATSVTTTAYNPNLKVEVSKETEIGTDLTFNTNAGGSWFNAINLSFTYWKRTSENVIYRQALPPSSGVNDLLDNIINMSSNGYQFSLNMPVYNAGSWKWDFTTNWGHQISKIDGIRGGNDIILNSGAGDASLVLTPGTVIGQIYGYKALTSVDAVRTDGSRYIPDTDAEKSKYEIVDGRVVKKDSYQIQFADEKTPLGNPFPKFNASFINSISFKDIATLSFQVDWVYKSHLYNQTKEWMYRDGIHGDYDGVVTINGQTGAFPAYWSSAYYGLFGSLNGAGNNTTKDFFWEDASFARLRNISLSFDFSKVMNVKGLTKLQLVLTGRNIATITKYTGFDPEISSGGVNSAFDRGVDHNTLPNIKSYQVGLNVGF